MTLVQRQWGSLANVPLSEDWTTAHSEQIPSEIVPAGHLVRFQDRALVTFNVTAPQHAQMMGALDKLGQVNSTVHQLDNDLSVLFVGIHWNETASGAATISDYIFDIVVKNSGSSPEYFGHVFDVVHDALDTIGIHLPTLDLTAAGQADVRFYTVEPKGGLAGITDQTLTYIIMGIVLLIIIVAIIYVFSRRR